MSIEGWTLLIGGLLVLFAIYVIAKIIAGGITLATTKVCPSCKERVKSGAAKCRFCGYSFGGGQPPSGPSTEERAGM